MFHPAAGVLNYPEHARHHVQSTANPTGARHTPAGKNSGAKEVSDALAKLLGDTYLLYIKTHGFHWNVVGEDFYQLHKLFQEQYNALFDAADTIAERIRALGLQGAGQLRRIAGAVRAEEQKTAPKAAQMIAELAADNRACARQALAANNTAEENGDPTTADMTHLRIEYHDKAAWMLEAC